MQTFAFPHHTVEDEYPESSQIVQFGKSYKFASKPSAPDQIVFTLSFEAMFFFVDDNGALDRVTEPATNMQLLVEFYENHRLYEQFQYDHVRRGICRCRFDKPLIVPKVIKDRNGLLEPFELKLVLCP